MMHKMTKKSKNLDFGHFSKFVKWHIFRKSRLIGDTTQGHPH